MKVKKNIIKLNKEYKIKITEDPLSLVILTHSQKDVFKTLKPKTKIQRLQYLKREKQVEETLKKIIAQSRYLKLYKDVTGLHIRIESDLEEKENILELFIVDYIIGKYGIYVNEEVNTGMSGDINRILISKGTKTIDY
jgi:hypothetical protein